MCCCVFRKPQVQTALWILHLLLKWVHLQINLHRIILPLVIIWDRWWLLHFNLLSRAIFKTTWLQWQDSMFAALYLQFRGWPWLSLLIWVLKLGLGLLLVILKLTLWLDGFARVIGMSKACWCLILFLLRTTSVLMIFQVKLNVIWIIIAYCYVVHTTKFKVFAVMNIYMWLNFSS